MIPALTWHQMQTLAAKEFRDRLRNRWVLAVAVVFTAFSLLITYFGSAAQGQIGPRSIGETWRPIRRFCTGRRVHECLDRL